MVQLIVRGPYYSYDDIISDTVLPKALVGLYAKTHSQLDFNMRKYTLMMGSNNCFSSNNLLRVITALNTLKSERSNDIFMLIEAEELGGDIATIIIGEAKQILDGYLEEEKHDGRKNRAIGR